MSIVPLRLFKDYLSAGGTADDLRRLIADAPLWTPPAERDGPNAREQGARDSGEDGQDGDGDKPLTECVLAELLVAWHGNNFRHVSTWNKFQFYDETRWKLDHNKNHVAQLALDTVRRRCLGLPEKLVKEFERVKSLNAMIEFAAHHPDIAIDHHVLNQDPWLLNCLNGTIDLRTGELREHRRADNITQLCPVEYDPDATCLRWLDTLSLVFGCDQSLIDYLQRLFGYFLTGSTQEQIFPIFYGSGENGKSTILNTLLHLLGPDYAMKAPRNFMLARRGETHPTELADLHGRRLAIAIESGQGQRIDETMVKEATGGDPIRARRMREDFWEFLPTHKIVMCTNHKPRIEGTDHAIWRRVMLIPFLVRIPADRKDPRFPEKLKQEAPGILAWCVRGALNWLDLGGLEPPDVIVASTADYRSEEDLIGAFVAEECVTQLPCSPQSQIKGPATLIYQRYVTWCEARGETPTRQIEFGKRMTELGVVRYQNHGIWYAGIGLRADDHSHPQDQTWD